MAVEVTSYDADIDDRDRVEAACLCADRHSGVPAIDRDSCEVTVHSEPDGERYELVHRVPLGKEIRLPAPVGIPLETEPLKAWARRHRGRVAG